MIFSTLSLYIARKFIFWFISTLLVLSALLSVFDMVELLRRASNKDVDISIILQMVAAKSPYLIQEVFPFIILFATMITFGKMAKSSELIIARAAGVSAWQIIFPVIIITLTIGIFQITAFSPFSSIMRTKYENMEDKYLNHNNNRLAVSPTGIWLRQQHPLGKAVIHALASENNGEIMKNVNIFILDNNHIFQSRIDAEEAILKPGFWEIKNAKLLDNKGFVTEVEIYRLATSLTGDKINNSFSSADSLSFWQLPELINTLEEAGFNTDNHRLRLHVMLATPLLLCAMVLIASVFSIGSNLRSHSFYKILGGIFCGFVLYLATNVVHAIGLATNLPIILAAWIPIGVSVLLGISAILHWEDG